MINSKLLLTLSIVPLGLLTVWNGYGFVSSFSAETVPGVPEPVIDSGFTGLPARAETNKKTADTVNLMESALSQFNNPAVTNSGEVPAERVKNVSTYGGGARAIGAVWGVYNRETDVEIVADLDNLIKDYQTLSFTTPPLTSPQVTELEAFVENRVGALEQRKEELVILEEQAKVLVDAKSKWKSKDYTTAKRLFESLDVAVFERAKSTAIDTETLLEYREGCDYYIRLKDELDKLNTTESQLAFVELDELTSKLGELQGFIEAYPLPPAMCDDAGHGQIQQGIEGLSGFRVLLAKPFIQDLEKLPKWCNEVEGEYAVLKTKTPKYVEAMNKRLVAKIHEGVQGLINAVQIDRIPMLNNWVVVFTVDDQRILIASRFNKALKSVEPRLNPKPPKELYHEGKQRLIPLAIGFTKFDRTILPNALRDQVQMVLGAHNPEGSPIPLIKIYDEVEAIQTLLSDNKAINFDVWNTAQDRVAEQLVFIETYNKLGGGVPANIAKWLSDVDATLGSLLANEEALEQLLDLLQE